MQHFSRILGLQHLDVPYLKGRIGKGTNGAVREGKSKGETGVATEKKKAELDAEMTEEVGTSDRAKIGGRVIKDRVDRKKEAKT